MIRRMAGDAKRVEAFGPHDTETLISACKAG